MIYLIVDEICGSGQTITMVKQKVATLGATAIKSAVLYAHTWGVDVPDYIGLVTDALAQQGLRPDPSLVIDATPMKLAKS